MSEMRAIVEEHQAYESRKKASRNVSTEAEEETIGVSVPADGAYLFTLHIADVYLECMAVIDTPHKRLVVTALNSAIADMTESEALEKGMRGFRRVLHKWLSPTTIVFEHNVPGALIHDMCGSYDRLYTID